MITTQQIRELRSEAGSNGDLKMVKICDRALNGSARARRECEKVINRTRAQNPNRWDVEGKVMTNPKRKARGANALSVATSHGFPYVDTDGGESHGGVWFSRFSKTADRAPPYLLVGLKGSKWVVRHKNPRRRRRARNPDLHEKYVIFRTDGNSVHFLASMPYGQNRHPAWGDHGIHWPTKGGALAVAKSMTLSASWQAGVAPASASKASILQTLRGKV